MCQSALLSGSALSREFSWYAAFSSQVRKSELPRALRILVLREDVPVERMGVKLPEGLTTKPSLTIDSKDDVE